MANRLKLFPLVSSIKNSHFGFNPHPALIEKVPPPYHLVSYLPYPYHNETS